MNEDFVTFEIAKKLEDKSFDWDASEMFERNIMACRYEDYRKPTISQVLKWLREEKEIMVSPIYSPNTSKWYCVVVNADSLEQYKLSLSDSYELAALAGIEYVLDNLI